MPLIPSGVAVILSVMPRRGGQAHVATIKTKGKGGKEYTSYLLRRSYREGGKVRHENLGNLSHLPLPVIDAIRKMLAGRVLVDLEERLQIERSLPHGHVAAVLGVLRSWIWSGCCHGSAAASGTWRWR